MEAFEVGDVEFTHVVLPFGQISMLSWWVDSASMKKSVCKRITLTVLSLDGLGGAAALLFAKNMGDVY